jgi:archaemetzincin
MLRTPWWLFLAILAIACGSDSSSRAWQLRRERLAPPFESLKRDASPKVPAFAGDWLASHPETGQSIAEFMGSNPAERRGEGKVVEVIPLGEFDPAQREILVATADYLSRFFGTAIRSLPSTPLAKLPPEARRFRNDLGYSQLQTGYVLDHLLPEPKKSDVIARIILTSEDLYPDSSWNFVFGQASSSQGAGVWSIFRFGDPAASPEAFRLCLLRTIKTASHEVGHMLSLPHCIAYECVMNGSNHLQELDRLPAELCPVCLQKVCWITGVDPKAREARLGDFFKAHGLTEEQKAAARRLARLAEMHR